MHQPYQGIQNFYTRPIFKKKTFAEKVFPQKLCHLTLTCPTFYLSDGHPSIVQILNQQSTCQENLCKTYVAKLKNGSRQHIFPQKHFRARGFAFKKSADNVDKVATLSRSLFVFISLRRTPWGNSIQHDRHS